MIVKNNMSALHTLNTLNGNSSNLAQSLRKVSSGMRINGAADDASAYAISERMRVQIRSLNQADRNTQNGISLLKVAGGAVQSTVDILKTLKEKVVNAANDSNTDQDRQQIQKELDQCIDQINENANITYNGMYLINGSHNSRVVHDTNTRGTTTLTSMSSVQGRGTYSHFVNDRLAKNKQISNALVNLQDRNGQQLDIQTSDTVTVSFVREAKTYTTSFHPTVLSRLHDALRYYAATATYGDVQAGTDPMWNGNWYPSTPSDQILVGHDASGNDVYTADREPAITVMAGGPGLDGQIAGFTISVSDSNGNIKKSVNAVLNEWKQVIRAEDESEDNSLVLQTGTKANQAVKIGFADLRARALGLEGSDGTKLNISTQLYANVAINVLDNAIEWALSEQTKIGSVASRLEFTSANLVTAAENVTASESTIRDADMAKEMMEYTKNNVLLQASQSMLSQANQSSSNVLSLLQ